MAHIDFPEIAEVVNLTRTTTIDPEPADGDGSSWTLYQGRYRVHLHDAPFRVLWLNSRITKVELEKAMARYNTQNTHLVHPPGKGVADRVRRWRKLYDKVQGPHTPKEYLRSFMRDELDAYVGRMNSQEPAYYVAPRIETRLRYPNAVEAFLAQSSEEESGALGIVLAEPGQGKTYMSRHVVHRLASVRGKDLVPIMVDSTQWRSMPEEDHSNLWKTIVHSFRYYGAPVGWVEGHEEAFLNAACKADLFRIVFDGFDEFILRNSGRVDPMDVLSSLSDLVTRTGARVVITSRTSFWNTNLSHDDANAFLEETDSSVFRIEPFDLSKARDYFQARFEKASDCSLRVKHASQYYQALEQQNEKLAGRGFVLNLVADVVERGDTSVSPSEHVKVLPWLMRALCQREELRQELPLSADDQMRMMRLFASEAVAGLGRSTDALDLVLLDIRDDLDAATRERCLEKFRSHPLLEYDIDTELWDFKEQQIGTFLLAQEVLECPLPRLRDFVREMELSERPGVLQDLASTVVDLHGDGAPSKISGIISALSRGSSEVIGNSDAARLLAGRIALLTVDGRVHQGSPRTERTQLLLQLTDGTVEGLHLAGTIASYDLSGVIFRNCRFDHITFARCLFDANTLFENCDFVGGIRIVRSDGFISRSIDIATCHLDLESKRWLLNQQVGEGDRAYSEDDLRADINSVLDKFISKGGMALKTLKEPHLRKGPIGVSPHQKEIVNEITDHLLEAHPISNVSANGLNVRAEAVEAFHFYATNNVYTGAIHDVYSRLKRKLIRQ